MTGEYKHSHRKMRRREFEGLTELENNFVNEYIIDMDATNAYIRAGYQSKYPSQDAYHLRRKDKIANAIAACMTRRNAELNIDAKFVLIEASYQYREAAQRASADPRERSHALKSLEMIGKHVDVQAFRHQVGIGNPDGTNYDFTRLTNDQLDQLERLLSIAAGIEYDPDSEEREGSERGT